MAAQQPNGGGPGAAAPPTQWSRASQQDLHDIAAGVLSADIKANVVAVQCGYARRVLTRTDEHEVVVATWAAGAVSELHGHGTSAGYTKVVAGALREERYIPEGTGYRFEARVFTSGDTCFMPPGAYHRVESIGPTVTVHVYDPPLPLDSRGTEVASHIRPLLDAARRHQAS